MVQSEAALAEEFLKLKSARSDVLIFTWDRKVDRPGFLYQPNTFWPHGRQILLEAGRELKHKYKYYVMMDDDVEFIKGSLIGFEDAVLQKEPDFCQPAYVSNKYIAKYVKITPFRYSAFAYFDCAFICFKRELFFDDKIYYLRENLLNKYYYKSLIIPVLFWMRLLEWFSHLKLMVFNDFHICNTKHSNAYHYVNFDYTKLEKLARKKYSNFSSKYLKLIPIIQVIRITNQDLVIVAVRWNEILSKICIKAGSQYDMTLSKSDIQKMLYRSKILWKAKKYKLLRKFAMFQAKQFLLNYRGIAIRYLTRYAIISGLWRDLKLNLRLWREERHN